MAPPARVNQLQMEQVRNIVVEEFNNAFNQLIPGVSNDIINQVKALLDERLAAIPGGALPAPPIRDSAYYFEKFSKSSSGQGEKNPLICYNCKKPGRHWKNCRAPLASVVPQITSAAPICYHSNETGHKRPECPKLKAGKGGEGTNPTIASSSKGPTMVTRVRAHQMTTDEPVITATVADLASFRSYILLALTDSCPFPETNVGHLNSNPLRIPAPPFYLSGPTFGDAEIDRASLKIGEKIASGSCGDLCECEEGCDRDNLFLCMGLL
ncbi:unnamed protein product [Lactuca saligna]|uniref:CCHC-type domain-containing protein n=1 Tax=Lactuca saligna TaxID=75948 RepID=A0AA35YIL9_LACSI|nr:unnamed protein product [Lactuca saligna]